MAVVAHPPGTPGLLRALNDRSALDLLVEHGPLTRTRVGELTGLSKPTASLLLSRLEAAGLVRSAGTTSGSHGPGAALYEIDPAAGLAAGVSVTPYTADAEIVDVSGRALGRARVDLPRRAGERSPVSDVTGAVRAAARVAGVDPGRLAAVVVGAQGALDRDSDTLVHAGHMPGWSGPGLLSALTRGLGAAVCVDNDVNLAAVAERAAAGAAAAGCSALLWLGDGLGLAVHVGGVVHRGATGGAGEIGYMPVPHPAGSGSVQLQDLVGGPEVLRLARGRGLHGRSAALVVARAADGAADDSAGAGFLRELAARVAVGLAAIVAVLDPDVVVLGGPVGRAGGVALRDLVRSELARICPLRPRLEVSAVAADPVLAGATVLALAHCRDLVFSGAAGSAGRRAGDSPPASSGAPPSTVHDRVLGASR